MAATLLYKVFWLNFFQDFSYVWFLKWQRQQILHIIHINSAKAFLYQQSHFSLVKQTPPIHQPFCVCCARSCPLLVQRAKWPADGWGLVYETRATCHSFSHFRESITWWAVRSLPYASHPPCAHQWHPLIYTKYHMIYITYISLDIYIYQLIYDKYHSIFPYIDGHNL